MLGAPGLEKVERFCAAHLSDRDAVGPQPERRTDEIGERGDAVLRAQGNQVWGSALQFAGVFDRNHPII